MERLPALAQMGERPRAPRRLLEPVSQHVEREHAAFVEVPGSPFPICVTAENGIVAILPFDAVAWTEETSQVLTAMTAAAKHQVANGPKLFAITGTATKLAKKNLTKLGWKVRENIPTEN